MLDQHRDDGRCAHVLLPLLRTLSQACFGRGVPVALLMEPVLRSARDPIALSEIARGVGLAVSPPERRRCYNPELHDRRGRFEIEMGGAGADRGHISWLEFGARSKTSVAAHSQLLGARCKCREMAKSSASLRCWSPLLGTKQLGPEKHCHPGQS